MAQESDR